VAAVSYSATSEFISRAITKAGTGSGNVTFNCVDATAGNALIAQIEISPCTTAAGFAASTSTISQAISSGDNMEITATISGTCAVPAVALNCGYK
jgi:hypothetical protein